eukprot:CAMPEP_0183743666 /NCGR_PEP_ID=MMETSP0737-20130205/65334_1 /TAXON_ID=385413 /ORGANISM="Thalassiosira miniscula, Strain CCMP1093" /LENGTH=847 /DNA_ID=CAMNT_0025979289 /DNA_START=56 /DNA_END=2600 /DNA_ORIENTATION=-
MIFKLSQLLSISAVAISIAPKMAAAQDFEALLDCIDLSSGALLAREGCQCDALVAFCNTAAAQFLADVPDLGVACSEGAVPCCSEAGTTDIADYNACLEETGVSFPDLTALGVTMPEGVGSPIVPEDCSDLIMESMMGNNSSDVEEGLMSCCMENPDHSYCAMLACLDEETNEPIGECDCSVGMNVYTDESLPFYHMMGGVMNEYIEACCTPGETTFEEFNDCLERDPALPAICDQDPNAPICSCVDEDSYLDSSCDCGVMLDLYAEDNFWGMHFGVNDAASIESCCTRGDQNVSEALECIYNGYDCGAQFGMLMNQLDSMGMGDMGDIESCCSTGVTIGEATECVSQIVESGHSGGGYGDMFGDGAGSLMCWNNDPSTGQGYSMPASDDDVCTSFCWNCALSTPDDTLCTDEQRANGTKLSMNMGIPLDYLDSYEMTYGNFGFTSCNTDNCNKVDACSGEELGVSQEGCEFGFTSCDTDNCNKVDACSGEELGVSQEGCVEQLNQFLMDMGNELDIYSCCEANPDVPYCAYHNCFDPWTGEMSNSCGCSVLVNLYTDPSSPMHMPYMSGMLETCCTPGQTSLVDAAECLDSTAAEETTICDISPDSLACACMNDAGEIDDSCDCGVMLDLYSDPSFEGAGNFVNEIVDLESCCTPGMTVAETSECVAGDLFEDFFGGLFGTSLAPNPTPLDDMGDVLEDFLGGLFGTSSPNPTPPDEVNEAPDGDSTEVPNVSDITTEASADDGEALDGDSTEVPSVPYTTSETSVDDGQEEISSDPGNGNPGSTEEKTPAVGTVAQPTTSPSKPPTTSPISPGSTAGIEFADDSGASSNGAYVAAIGLACVMMFV